MSLLVLDGVGRAFGAHTVLQGVSFALGRGERAGLIGPNGAGKTTLLDIASGAQMPDAGRVALARSCRLVHLTQDPQPPPGETVRSAALAASRLIGALETQMAALGDALAAGDTNPQTLAAYGEAQQRFEQAGGYEREHTTETALRGLGLGPELWATPVEHLSGGQRMRLSLCRAVLEEPDVLLCDEPTNHLDADAVSWLEGRLARWAGALLCVSHDRYFLDRVCTRILELSDGQLTHFPGNYSAYVHLRDERAAQARQERERAEAEAERLAAYVERYRAGNRARQARSREHRLERLRAGMAPPPAAAAQGPKLHLEPRSPTGREVLVVENLAKAYRAQTLFAPFTATVERGERIGIVGPNGAGKTTLLRMLAGQEAPDAGESYWGRGVEVSWLRQDLAGLDDDASVLENVLAAQADLGGPEARHLLARFLFRGDTVFRRAGDLSGGERNRLLLCLLSLEQGNVLLCDEPTNHLDIPAREALEQALEAFSGTLLVVSHDRYLLRRLCTRIWWLDQGRVRDLAGGYAAYETTLTAAVEAASASPPAPARHRPVRVPPEPAAPPPQRTPARPRKQQDRLAALEARIAEQEAELTDLGARLADPALYQAGQEAAAVVRAYEALKLEIEEGYRQWERLVDAEVGQRQESSRSARS